MPKSTILKALKGLTVPSSATDNIKNVVKTRTLRVEPEAAAPKINYASDTGQPILPEPYNVTNPEPYNVQFNDAQDLQKNYPEIYEGIAQSDDVTKRGQSIDSVIDRLSKVSQQEEDYLLARPTQGDTFDYNVETYPTPRGPSDRPKGQRLASPSASLNRTIDEVRTNTLKEYLRKINVGFGKNSGGYQLLQSAIKKDGGTGDRLASRLVKGLQKDQIARDNSYATSRAIENLVEQSLEDLTYIPRVSKTTDAANLVKALSPREKYEVIKSNIDALRDTFISNETVREGIAKGNKANGIFSVPRSTALQNIGKKVVKNNPKLEYNNVNNLKSVELLQAQKNHEISLALALNSRLFRDGEFGFLDSAFSNRSQQRTNRINQIEAIPPTERTAKEASELADLNKNRVYDNWDIKAVDTPESQTFVKALNDYDNITGNQSSPIVKAEPTVINDSNIKKFATIKKDLPEDLEHLDKIKANSVFGQSLKHNSETAFAVDMELMIDMEEILQKAGQTALPSLRPSVYSNQLNLRNKALSRGDIKGARTLEAKAISEQAKDEVKIDKLKKTLEEADKYKNDKFYFNPWYDSRGRQGYKTGYLDPQGDAYSRALLSLGDRVPVNAKWKNDMVNEIVSFIDTPQTKALKTPNQRLEWFELNKDSILKWGDNPAETYDDWINKVKSKNIWQMLKGLKELDKFEKGMLNTSGYIIGLDAVTSQAQMVSMLTRNKTLGSYTGLTKVPASDDIYIKLGNQVFNEIDARALNHNQVPDNNALYWAQPSVKNYLRDIMKRPVMTYSYNAGREKMAKALVEDASGFPKANDINNPLHSLDYDKARYLIDILFDKAEKDNAFQSVVNLKKATKTLAKNLIEKTGKIITKTRSDGSTFPAPEFKYNYKPGDAFEASSGFFWRQHERPTVSATVRTPWYSRSFDRTTNNVTPVSWEETSFGYQLPELLADGKAYSDIATSYAPNYIHHLDADVLAHTVVNLKKKGIPTVTVHDQFGVPAGYGNELRQAYVDALKTVFSKNKFKDEMEQLIPSDVVKTAEKQLNIQDSTSPNYLDVDDLDDIVKNYWTTGVSPLDV